MTSRERVLSILRGEPADRPAVVCPGGMMSLAVTEVMDACGAGWPEAHYRADAMARLAEAMQAATGFDNVAAPFCMTVEAEAYGAEVDPGTRTIQPKVRVEPLPASGAAPLPRPDWHAGRAAVLLEALGRLAATSSAAVVGNLVGPVSLLGMLIDPQQVLRWPRRRPEVLARYLERLTDDLAAFGRLQVEAGADLVCIAEPTGTGEILGGAAFRRFALPCLARLADRLHEAGVPVIVHICGDCTRIDAELRELPVEAVSFDAGVDLVALASRRPPWQPMGNLSALLLEDGPPGAIRRRAARLAAGRIRLIAPACGVVATTPLAHLCEVVASVRSG